MAAFLHDHTSQMGRRRSTNKPMAEINITPFVDVMLVLLVVFMITAPLLSVGVPVDLPKAVADSLQGSEEPLTITIDESERIFLQETEIDIQDLVPQLLAISRNVTSTRIFVRGDQNVPYRAIMQVMGTVNAAGFNKVALVAQAPKVQ